MVDKRMCYYIPDDGSSYVEGYGYRVALVIENEPGYILTGTWPYTGAVEESMPYFWGHDLSEAKLMAAQQNKEMGLDEHDTFNIIMSSMNASRAQRISNE